MKWVNRIAGSLLGLVGIGIMRNFFSKYQILVFDKQDLGEEDDFSAFDLRGTPTHACVCGSNVWYIKAVFDNYEIATYFLDMQCAECGSIATAPTPVDREGMEN